MHIYIYSHIHIYIYMCVLFFVVFQSGAVFLAICCILELKSHICMRTWLLVFSSWFRLHLASVAANSMQMARKSTMLVPTSSKKQGSQRF